MLIGGLSAGTRVELRRHGATVRCVDFGELSAEDTVYPHDHESVDPRLAFENEVVLQVEYRPELLELGLPDYDAVRSALRDTLSRHAAQLEAFEANERRPVCSGAVQARRRVIELPPPGGARHTDGHQDRGD